MRRKTIATTVYVTADNKEFRSQREAISHEKEIVEKITPEFLIEFLSNECDKVRSTAGCKNCKFFKNECILRWNIPMKWKEKMAENIEQSP